MPVTPPFEATIYLAENYYLFNVKKTAVHELLHALGFEHEHHSYSCEIIKINGTLSLIRMSVFC